MNYKKIPFFKLIPLIFISIIFYKLISNIEILTLLLTKLLSFLSYFVWGWFIAFLLNPALVLVENKFKTKRVFSIIIVYVFFLGIIALTIELITPVIIKNISELISKIPDFVGQTEKYIKGLPIEYESFDKLGIDKYIEQNLNNIIQKMNSLVTSSLNIAFLKLKNFTSSMFKLFSGILISIYMLLDKENIIKESKRILFSIFNKEHSENILEVGKKTHEIFSQYVIGKFIDSILVFLIFVIILGLFKIPYYPLISLMMGITNMIPYFGNLIGAVPSLIIVILVNPVKFVLLIILIIIICEFENWVIGPKILGNKVGLSPLLILMAMAIGGGICGIWGMFLSVPIMAVIKTLIREYTDKKLTAKNIDI